MPPAETQEPISEEEVISEVSEQDKEATLEATEKTSNVEDVPKQSSSYLKTRFVVGLVTLLIGLWAANLALFNWIERAGLHYLLAEYARYVCAYGGFAAMIFGAMLINDFLVFARSMGRKVMVPQSNETPYHEAMLCESEEEEEKIVVEQET